MNGVRAGLHHTSHDEETQTATAYAGPGSGPVRAEFAAEQAGSDESDGR